MSLITTLYLLLHNKGRTKYGFVWGSCYYGPFSVDIVCSYYSCRSWPQDYYNSIWMDSRRHRTIDEVSNNVRRQCSKVKNKSFLAQWHTEVQSSRRLSLAEKFKHNNINAIIIFIVRAINVLSLFVPTINFYEMSIRIFFF